MSVPIDKRKRPRQQQKATNFSQEELYVLFEELTARFDDYFLPRGSQQTPGPTRQKIYAEIAAIITNKCGVERKEKQVLERIRLETNRLKERLEMEASIQGDPSQLFKIPPLPPYLYEMEAPYRKYMNEQEGNTSTRAHNLFGIQEKYCQYNVFNESPISTLDLLDAGSSTSFSSSISFEDDFSKKKPRITTSISHTKKFATTSESSLCSNCGSEESRERMRICSTCITTIEIEIDEKNFDQLLLQAYCVNCAMDEHVDKGHKTEKLVVYDKHYQVGQEIIAKLMILKDGVTMARNDLMEMFDLLRLLDELTSLPFDPNHPAYPNPIPFASNLDEMTTMLIKKAEIDKSIQMLWKQINDQIHDLKPLKVILH